MKFLLPLLAVTAFLAGCNSGGGSSDSSGTPSPEAPPNAVAAQVGGPAGAIKIGGKYWTRTNLRIVKGTQIDYESWLSGELLPMGTGCTVTETAKSDTRWHIKLDDGRDMWVFPVDRGQDPYREIQRFLVASDPRGALDAAGDIADGIKKGEPKVGMTKAQVLAACGFPPHVSDPGASNRWEYPQLGRGWQQRGWARVANQHRVYVDFTDGKVSHVSGWELE